MKKAMAAMVMVGVAAAGCSTPAKKAEDPRGNPPSTGHTSEAPTTAPDLVTTSTPLPADTTTTEPEPVVPSPPARLGPTTTPVPAPSPAATTPLPPVDDQRTAVVSFYGYELAGNSTANGEAFDPEGLTFAHKTMAFDTLVQFCGAKGCVVARCNDRGPFIAGRSFDLSLATFRTIEPVGAGVAEVTWSYA